MTSISIPTMMFLMFPWVIGQLVCIFMDGTYIGIWEQNIINVVGAYQVPTQNLGVSIMTGAYQIFTSTLPRILLWDYSFFDGAYAIFRWILLFVLTIPFLLGLMFGMISLAQGIFSKVV